MILYGLWQRFRWGRAVAELREISQGLDASYGLRGHRGLHNSFDEFFRSILELSKSRPAARWVLDELRPVVAQYHRRSVVGSAGAWDEMRNAFLERKRHPVRLMRAAAGWVVLLGLAGTVLGFMEALPALREVLASQADEAATVSQAVEGTPLSPSVNGATEPERSDSAEQAALTGEKLNRVLDSLRGVFLATLGGVISAFFLSACTLLLLEPAFDRFADHVDILGVRWFEPLIQPPDTLIDDALRGELRLYFDEIGKRLETVLSPLISQLRLSLEQMSGLAADFSGNIRMGVDTLQTFHGAVQQLGGSAQSAVDQLVQIVRTSGDFVREVESLQQKGLDKLADALSGPAGILADSAAAMDARVQALANQIASLGDSSNAIAEAIGEHSQGEAALRQDLSSNVDVLRHQMQALSHLRAGVESTAKSLRTELSPLFASLSKELIEAQARSAQEGRSTTEKVAAGVDSIRGMLLSLQALASPERIQEERRALEELRRAVESLRRQHEQPATAWARQAPQPMALPREHRPDPRRPVEKRKKQRPSAAPQANNPYQPPREPKAKPEGGIIRLLRWLGLARTSDALLLSELKEDDRTYGLEPAHDATLRSGPAPHNRPMTAASPSGDPEKKPRSQPSVVDSKAWDQVVYQFLEETPSPWEIRQLAESLQLTQGNDTPIKIQQLTSDNSGEWRLAALWPQSSPEGLVIVNAGELIDDDITRYFDAPYGHRIIRCLQPANVMRSGDEITVLHKGQVEST